MTTVEFIRLYTYRREDFFFFERREDWFKGRERYKFSLDILTNVTVSIGVF